MTTPINQREGKGCWLSDRTIAQLLLLDRKPLHLYLLLCGPRSQESYPSASDLAELLGLTRKQVIELLYHLRAFRLLNDADLTILLGKAT